MQVRRALVVFVVVFAVVTLIAAIAAPREETDDTPVPPAAVQQQAATVTVPFRHPVEDAPPVRELRRGSHAVIRVEAGVPGDVEIPALGLVQPVVPGTPAVFDILATRSGRFDVSLLSVAGERTKLGTLVVID